MRQRAVSLLLAVFVTAGCADTPAAAPSSPGTPEVVGTDDAGNPVRADDVRPTGPVTELPTCGVPPADSGVEPPVGLFLPTGTIVTAVEDLDPVVSIEAYVPMTPSQVRRAYENASGYEVLNREDESFDAEVLVTDGATRAFVKVVAACDRASNFLVVVSAETDP